MVIVTGVSRASIIPGIKREYIPEDPRNNKKQEAKGN